VNKVKAVYQEPCRHDGDLPFPTFLRRN